MNRSVVTHHRTAWWRSHRATSRWIAGGVRRRRSGRGRKGVTGPTSASRSTPLAPLQPPQKATGQRRRDRVPLAAAPQPALGLVPAELSLGPCMDRRDRMAALGIARHLLRRRRGRQVAPGVLARLGRASRRARPDQPPSVPSPIPGHPPAAHGHTLLAQPCLGPLPPATRPPLPARQGGQPSVRPLPGGGRRTRAAHLDVGTPPCYIARVPFLQACQEGAMVAIIGISHHATMGPPQARTRSRSARALAALVCQVTSGAPAPCVGGWGRPPRPGASTTAPPPARSPADRWRSRAPPPGSYPPSPGCRSTAGPRLPGRCPVWDTRCHPAPAPHLPAGFGDQLGRPLAMQVLLGPWHGGENRLQALLAGAGHGWAMVSPCLVGSPVSSPVVYRSSAFAPSRRRKRPWELPKHSLSSGRSSGLACTSMGILL
jgi:hypothetical protein